MTITRRVAGFLTSVLLSFLASVSWVLKEFFDHLKTDKSRYAASNCNIDEDSEATGKKREREKQRNQDNRSSGRKGKNHDWNSDENNNTKSSSSASSLEAAYELFDIERTGATLVEEDIRRKWKELSRMHHPDRNNNSIQSKKMMQRINNCYEQIMEELDRQRKAGRKSSSSSDDDGSVSEPASPASRKNRATQRSHGEEDTSQPSSSPKKKREKLKQRKKWKREQRRKRQDEELEREMEIMRKQRLQVEQEILKTKNRIQHVIQREGLDSPRGREIANENWERAIHEFEQQRKTQMENEEQRRKKNEENRSYKSPEHDVPYHDTYSTYHREENEEHQKPINLVMECCLDEIIVALRMGFINVAIDIFQERLEEIMNEAIIDAMRNNDYEFHNKNPYHHQSTDEWMDDAIDSTYISQAAKAYLLRPLDDDNNTLLHYVVYYESDTMIDVINHLCHQHGVMTDVFLCENNHNLLPYDISIGNCVKDLTIPRRMERLTDIAFREYHDRQRNHQRRKEERNMKNVTKNTNRRKRGVNHCKEVSNFDWLLASSLCISALVFGYLIETYIFQSNLIISLLTLVFVINLVRFINTLFGGIDSPGCHD